MQIMKRFLKYLKPYWKESIAGFIIIILETVIILPRPIIIKNMIDTALPSKNIRLVIIFAVILGSMIILQKVLGFLHLLVFSKINQQVFANVRFDIYIAFQKMSMKFHSENKTGELLSKILSDVGMLQNMLTERLLSVLKDFMLTLIIMYIMLRMQLELTLLTFTMIPVFFIVYGFFGKQIYYISKEVQEKKQDLTGNLQEDLMASGQLINITNINNDRASKMYSQISDTEETSRKKAITSGLAGLCSTIIPVFSVGLVWGYGGWKVMSGDLTLGGLLAFSAYLGLLYSPFSRIFKMNIALQASLASAKRIFDVFDLVPDVKDTPNAKNVDILKGPIEFKDVSFSYSTKKEIFNNVNLTINPGKIVGIIGKSGAGKTTFVNLILRFYDSIKGEILINGENIKNIKLNSLKKNISIVPQSIFFFNASIKENIMVGMTNISMEDIIKYSKIANIHDFIMKLPEGYDTNIGTQGIKLSAGQRQRIAIVRALITNPKILILDEATSFLDRQSEKLIQKSLLKIVKDRIVIIISHKMSVMTIADRMLKIENKVISEI